MQAQICITGAETTAQQLMQRLETVFSANPSLLCEVRLDYLELSPKEAFRLLVSLPDHWCMRIILTQRLKAVDEIAAGRCNWTLPTWQNWWQETIRLKNWYATDLDFIVLDQLSGETLSWPASFHDTNVIFSIHSDLDQAETMVPFLLDATGKYNCGVKVACPVNGPAELLRFAEICQPLQAARTKAFVAMGAAGKSWRLSHLCGDISYFALSEKSKTAAGQLVWPDFHASRLPARQFVLLSDNADNTLGETRWNRYFKKNQIDAAYTNMACELKNCAGESPAANQQRFSEDFLRWMQLADIAGASVTMPFKKWFGQIAPADNGSINTIYRDRKNRETLRATSTDGDAVCELIRSRLPETESVPQILVLGGGGAAEAVLESAAKLGWQLTQAKRKNGQAIVLPEQNFRVVVNTLPDHALEELTSIFSAWISAGFDCGYLIDAQFSKTENDLQQLCKNKGIEYINGLHWWSAQAKKQAGLFDVTPPLDLGCLPRSKSETQRILTLATLRNAPTYILNPSICDDTGVLVRALRALGVRIDQSQTMWTVHPVHSWKTNTAVDVGENGTAFRLLAALTSRLPDGEIEVYAEPALQKRNVLRSLPEAIVTKQDWPVRLRTGAELPSVIDAGSTSQYASGCLIASAGYNRDFHFSGDIKSKPYIDMTVTLLNQAGFPAEFAPDGMHTRSARPEADQPWQTEVAVDASGYAFIQTALRFLNIPVSTVDLGNQGDAIFAEWLETIIRDKKLHVNLQSNPDLAPPLWTAAVLFRAKLKVTGAAHLRLKECDRIHAIAECCKILQLECDEKEDGFLFVPGPVSSEARILPAFGDHRMAMAAGILQLCWPGLEPDDKNCVNKSFPQFWHALEQIKGAIL